MAPLQPEASIPDLQLVYRVDMPFNKANAQLAEALNADVEGTRAEGEVEPVLVASTLNDPLTVSGRS